MVRVARRFDFIDLHPATRSLAEEVRRGLTSSPKQLPPKLFYDELGAKLFEEITRLPEYYLTRTELTILKGAATDLATELTDGSLLVELGSGSSTKVGILLDAAPGDELTYMPVDLSAVQLREAAERIAAERRNLSVVAVCADYSEGLVIPERSTHSNCVLFFPGSTVGNFEPDDARRFLIGCRTALSTGDSMILGADLRKDPAMLHAAYNDAAGVTAEFNINLLRRINRELGADFDLTQFRHEAFYDAARGRIEMHLRSLSRQTVHLSGESIEFEQGETIHTENSYKYSIEGIEALMEEAGFKAERFWTDPARLFSVHQFRAD